MPLNEVGQAAKTLWNTVGPLVGVLIGAYLGRRWQRSQWVADNKRGEYRKLLSTLTKTLGMLITYGAAQGPKEQKSIKNLQSLSIIVIQDRMFIAKEVEEIKLMERWVTAMDGYNRTFDGQTFIKAFDGIKDDLLKSASKILE